MSDKKFEDAVSFYEEVVKTFGKGSKENTVFVGLMRDFKNKTISSSDLSEQVKELFQGYPDLLYGFQHFLPDDPSSRKKASSRSLKSKKPSNDGVKVVLGTMEMGRPDRESADERVCRQMVEYFIQAGWCELDTALMYVDGKTEKILGRMKDLHSLIEVSTKVNPWVAPGLTAANILLQQEQCFSSLKTNQVDILYLHAPDHKTPIEETLSAMNALFRAGKYKRLGLSNYSSWQVAEIYYICKAKGYVLPTVYQGMYNAITRDVDRELFPCLKRFGISFYAYNPLAGGLLAGRYKYSDVKKKPTGRFFGNSWAKNYRQRYWKKSVFEGLDIIKTALDKAYRGKVSMVQASIRWLMHHSELGQGDGVIIGASSMHHLKDNVVAASQGRLHREVVDAFDKAWNMNRANVPCYFR